MGGLLNEAAPTFAPPTAEDVSTYIDAAVDPNGLQIRADYLKKFGVAPSPELIAWVERQRRSR